MDGVTRKGLERLRCAVPFCRRTWKGDGRAREWICQEHWRGVPQDRRRVWSRAKRQARLAVARDPQVSEWWLMPPGSKRRAEAIAMWQRLDRLWGGLKRRAIERAAGIG